jgi:hypothetical protein
MILREIIAYSLIIVLIAAAAWVLLRWRKRVLHQRLMRWGTTAPPGRLRRRT